MRGFDFGEWKRQDILECPTDAGDTDPRPPPLYPCKCPPLLNESPDRYFDFDAQSTN